MCITCGCSSSKAVSSVQAEPIVVLPLDHDHNHDHNHDHKHDHDHAHQSQRQRVLQIEKNILSANDEYARLNRSMLEGLRVVAINLLSSPGSGKTSLLEKTVIQFSDNEQCWVIEGDQQTSRDADRIKAAGASAIQINTGKGCHLDAHQVHHAIESLHLQQQGFLFIENVGNLVCPASFDLGEAKKVVVLSVTEGDDKPLKYPDMFHVADLVLINKLDLLPYVDFQLDRCIEYIKQINDKTDVIKVSCRDGQGLENWFSWLKGLQVVAKDFADRSQV